MLTKNPRDFVVHFGYADRETSSMQWKVRKGSKWIAAEFSPRFWGGGRDELKAGEKVSFTVAIPKVIHSPVQGGVFMLEFSKEADGSEELR
jgi:hypothetical protein